jgi:hypothetical protein
MANEVTCPECQSEKVEEIRGAAQYEASFIERHYECECGHKFAKKHFRETPKHQSN